MKTTIALLLSLCFSISLCAEEDPLPCEKTYVTPNQIFLEETSFFVQIGDLWIQPAALYVDVDGFYFNSLRQNELCPGPWQCKKPGCLEWNEEWRDNCKRCGYPKGK